MTNLQARGSHNSTTRVWETNTNVSASHCWNEVTVRYLVKILTWIAAEREFFSIFLAILNSIFMAKSIARVLLRQKVKFSAHFIKANPI